MRSGSAAPRVKKRSVSRSKGKDPLLSAICHDLRAPLAAVTMGASYVLQTTQRQEENARSVKILEAMLRSCTHMERLIRNFADLSEIEADAVELRPLLQDTGELVHLVKEAAKDAAVAKDVEIVVEKAEPPIALRIDRDRMLRALGHLVDNAVRHAPSGSKVTIAVAPREAAAAISVVDTGPGLTPQLRRNLFDRQWHAKRANRVGAGFGLAIARGFAVAHGGRLVVESKPDQATSFTMVVPLDF